MKKVYLIISLIILIIIVSIIILLPKKTESITPNTLNIENNITFANKNNIKENNTTTVMLDNTTTTNTIQETKQKKEPASNELGTFTTEILTDDSNRNSNIRLTCKKLNNHIVEKGKTFSFTGLIGKSTEEKGYKKANIISNDGETIKGLGGGNCQVSSTLYNSVVDISGIEIKERHNHGAEVYYVPLGEDAAVAYGSIDFKFKNNTDYDIKIKATTDDKEITITITSV